MNIINSQVNQVSSVRMQKVGTSGVKSAGAADKSDELIMSKLASEVQDVRQQIATLPETRSDLVERFKGMVSDGGYQVSGDDLASAMFSAAKGEM
jgi:flagellar biosynthesis anti-sigma factor FlgM